MLRAYAKVNLPNVIDFINRFGDSALAVQLNTGCSALAILAQMACETGWGGHTTLVHDVNNQLEDSMNLFNIKDGPGWQGKTGWQMVPEFYNNVWVQSKEYFRVYDNYTQSIEDYLSFIQTNPRYADAWANRFDSVKYIQGLANAGYATAPNYAQEIISIMNYDIEVKDDMTPD